MDIEVIIAKSVELESRYTALQLQKHSGIWLHDE